MRRLIVGLVLLLAVAGCAESTAEVNTPDAFNTLEADPQLVRGAERVLADAPAPEPGWRVGVIVAEAKSKQTGLFGEYDEWSIGVLTADGMVFLSGDWCDGEDEPNADRVLPVLVAPGDLITWTAKGHEVCSSKLRVLRKAAAMEGSTP